MKGMVGCLGDMETVMMKLHEETNYLQNLSSLYYNAQGGDRMYRNWMSWEMRRQKDILKSRSQKSFNAAIQPLALNIISNFPFIILIYIAFAVVSWFLEGFYVKIWWNQSPYTNKTANICFLWKTLLSGTGMRSLRWLRLSLYCTSMSKESIPKIPLVGSVEKIKYKHVFVGFSPFK